MAQGVPIDLASMLPMADEVEAPAPPPTAVESSMHFAYLVGGVVVVALVAENYKKLRALPARAARFDKKQVGIWAVFLALLTTGYIYQPEADDPSVAITFGAGVQLFTFLLLWVMPRKKATYYLQPTGDSPEFALLSVLALSLRLSSTLRWQGYLPSDATGDGCYQALEGLAALIAMRGLLDQGLTPRQCARGLAAIVGCAVVGSVCYGDLDKRPLWDRVYATSMYTEVVAWGFLAGSMFRAGPERTLKPGFLVPAIAHAVLRACFWFVAMDEMIPTNHVKLLMPYFPMVVVTAHFLLAALLGVLGLVILCAPEEDLPSSMVDARKVAPADNRSPLSSLLASARKSAGADGVMMPVRAVFEDGKLRVEYGPNSSFEYGFSSKAAVE